MAACIAARNFLHSLPMPAAEQQCFMALLPALCFNRLFVLSVTCAHVSVVVYTLLETQSSAVMEELHNTSYRIQILCMHKAIKCGPVVIL